MKVGLACKMAAAMRSKQLQVKQMKHALRSQAYCELPGLEKFDAAKIKFWPEAKQFADAYADTYTSSTHCASTCKRSKRGRGTRVERVARGREFSNLSQNVNKRNIHQIINNH